MNKTKIISYITLSLSYVSHQFGLASSIQVYDQENINSNHQQLSRTHAVTDLKEQFSYDQLYEKNESFWRPILNHQKALTALSTAKTNKDKDLTNHILSIIYEETQRPDYLCRSEYLFELSEKFYEFLSISDNQSLLFDLPENLRNLYLPQKFLRKGIKNNKAWAFQKQADLILDQVSLAHKDVEKARQYYVRAANAGNKNALSMLKSFFPKDYKFYNNNKKKIIPQSINQFITDPEIYPHQIYTLYENLTDNKETDFAHKALDAAAKKAYTPALMLMGIEYTNQKKYNNALSYFLKAIENGHKRANQNLTYILYNYQNLNLEFEIKERVLNAFLGVMENGEIIPPTSFNLLFDIKLKEDTPLIERLCTVFLKIIKSTQNSDYVSHIALTAIKLPSKPQFFSDVISFVKERFSENQNTFLDIFYQFIINNIALIPQNLINILCNFCLEEIENSTFQATLAPQVMEKIIENSEISEQIQKRYFEIALRISVAKNYKDLKKIALSAIFIKSHITSIKHTVIEHLLNLAKEESKEFLSSNVGGYLSILTDLCTQSKSIKFEHNDAILNLLLTASEKGDIQALDWTIRKIYNKKLVLNSHNENRFYALVVQNIESLTNESLNNIESLFSNKLQWILPNLSVVTEYLEKAAHEENIHAMILLGYAYLGIDPPTKTSTSASYFWLKKAADLGSTKAEKYLMWAESLSFISNIDEGQDPVLSTLLNRSLEFNNEIEDNFEKHQNLQNNRPEILRSSKIKTRKQAELSLAQNSKYQRSRAIELAQIIIKNKENELRPSTNPIKLSKKSEKTLAALEDKNAELSYNDLITLLEDDFFDNQIMVIHNNNKLMLVAHNHQTGEFKTALTHDNHERIKTLNIAFKQEIKKLLAIFKLSKLDLSN